MEDSIREDRYNRRIERQLEYLAGIYRCIGNVYLWTCRTDWTVVQSSCPWEMELRNIFLFNKNHETADRLFEDGKDYISLYDPVGLTWIILTHRDEDGRREANYIAGPVFTMDISQEILKRYMNASEMSISSQIRFLRLMDDIPVVPSSGVESFGAMLYYTVQGKHPEKDALWYEFQTRAEADTGKEEVAQGTAGKENVRTVEFHGSWRMEQELAHCVETGNLNFSFGGPETDYYEAGLMSPGDPMRQKKDELIVLAAIVTRAAIRGGVAPETAYTMSDYYVQQVEAAKKISDLKEIPEMLLTDFTQRVRETREKENYTPVMRDFIAMIRKSIPGNVDLDAIAKRLGYAPYYLTRTLRKETGKGFKEFVREAQMDYAKEKLKDPYTDVAVISERLGFTSPSYFSVIFREETGMTPTQYRKSLENRGGQEERGTGL